ncbi:MAG: cyclic nucleotide-binding domain-containing protein [Tatlockia sp.]|nr:cyclic nucleotide-binding domain-containing protein [Tatlockia sp.]
MDKKPAQPSIQASKSLAQRELIIKNTPGFAKLSPESLAKLAANMSEIHIGPGEIIVAEGDFVESIFIIAEGSAEVSKKVGDEKNSAEILLAILKQGEGIGIKESGLYSESSIRTATVTANTPCILLQITIDALQKILQKDPEVVKRMQETLSYSLKLRMIKEAAPFAQLSNTQISSLVSLISEVSFEKGDMIYNQGETGENCYMVFKGSVAIINKASEGEGAKTIATLEKGELFGEEAFLLQKTRNTSAQALSDCTLLELNQDFLLELRETYKDSLASDSLMIFLADKIHPIRAENIQYTQRTTANGDLIVTLKNTVDFTYCQLNEQEWFVWKQLNGELTPPQIAEISCKHFPMLKLEDVSLILQNLFDKGFAFLDTIQRSQNLKKAQVPEELSGWLQWVYFLKKPDKTASYLYKRGGFLLASTPALLIYIILAVIGLWAFKLSFNAVLLKIPQLSLFYLWILFAIPLSMFFTLLTPYLKIMAIKRTGFVIPRIGLIWQKVGPSVFVDDSDLLMTSRSPRIRVGITTILANLLVAGLLSLWAYYTQAQNSFVLYWICALLVYLQTLRLLNPLMNFEGYTLLVNIFDIPQLRQLALSSSKRAIRIGFFPKMVFRLACLFYLAINLFFVTRIFHKLISRWPDLRTYYKPAVILIVLSFIIPLLIERFIRPKLRQAKWTLRN